MTNPSSYVPRPLEPSGVRNPLPTAEPLVVVRYGPRIGHFFRDESTLDQHYDHLRGYLPLTDDVFTEQGRRAVFHLPPQVVTFGYPDGQTALPRGQHPVLQDATVVGLISEHAKGNQYFLLRSLNVRVTPPNEELPAVPNDFFRITGSGPVPDELTAYALAHGALIHRI